MSAEADSPELIEVLCEDQDAHWPVTDTFLAVCGQRRAAVLFVFRRERVTCEGCKAWLTERPSVTTWDSEATQ